jgi:hypothetical protein
LATRAIGDRSARQAIALRGAPARGRIVVGASTRTNRSPSLPPIAELLGHLEGVMPVHLPELGDEDICDAQIPPHHNARRFSHSSRDMFMPRSDTWLPAVAPNSTAPSLACALMTVIPKRTGILHVAIGKRGGWIASMADACATTTQKGPRRPTNWSHLGHPVAFIASRYRVTA